MVLVDSAYINNGGGLILLEYLIDVLEKNNIPVFYIFDERCKESFKQIPAARKFVMKASLYNRWKFYRNHNNKFTKVFCFGNIPPPIQLEAKVYTYFHQRLFLEIPSETSLKNKAIFLVKSKVWKLFKKNTDFWMVQTNIIAKDLSEKLNISLSKVLVLPFYPPLRDDREEQIRQQNSFLYVSSGNLHKNHEILIQAFCEFFNQFKKGSLGLTIGEEFPDLKELIAKKNEEGYPIKNFGHVDRNDIAEIYHQYEYHIYPSLSESFGLGLLESIECGCKIIGADLPYTYAVCSPSLHFNPSSVESIKEAFRKAILKEGKETIQISKNEINQLLEILNNGKNTK
jgi:glycosyltransferase involved in cell wall biosynthesis